MNKALLMLGIVGVAVPLYDEAALLVNENSPSLTLPFLWRGTPAQYIPEVWLAIIGAILIMIAAFVNLG